MGPHRPGRDRSRGCCRAAASSVSSSEERAGDYHAVHFARAFTDSADARLAIPSLDWKFFADAVAAVNLHGAIDDSAQHFARVEFRDRGLGAEILAAIGLPCTLPREPAGGAQFNFRIGEHPLNSLSFREQLAERAALFGVIDGHAKRGD